MKALEERIWLEENIVMLTKSPKKYYKGIFKEIIEEIKHNRDSLKNTKNYPSRNAC